MGKKKKDTIELRFYEIPQNEYVLALLGENWIRDYGHDEVHLHFHNLMEIGVCQKRYGETDSGRRTAPLSACYGKYYTEQLSSCDDQQYKRGTKLLGISVF